MKLIINDFELTITLITQALHYAKMMDMYQTQYRGEYVARQEQAYTQRSRLYKFFFDIDLDRCGFYFKSYEGDVKHLQRMLDRMIPLQAEASRNEFILEDDEIAVITKYAFYDSAKLEERRVNEENLWRN